MKKTNEQKRNMFLTIYLSYNPLQKGIYLFIYKTHNIDWILKFKP
jgi:hypothetical protein